MSAVVTLSHSPAKSVPRHIAGGSKDKVPVCSGPLDWRQETEVLCLLGGVLQLRVHSHLKKTPHVPLPT